MSAPTISRDDHTLNEAPCRGVVAGSTSDSGQGPPGAQSMSAAVGAGSRNDHGGDEAQGSAVVAGTTSGTGQVSGDTHKSTASAGNIFPLDQSFAGPHSGPVERDRSRSGPAARDELAPNAHPLHHGPLRADCEEGAPPTKDAPLPMGHTSLADPFLALAADVLDDAQDNRIANENRLRQLTRTDADADGEERGFGLDESHPDVARLAAIVDLLGDVEHKAELNLKRMLRAHPLGPWVKAQKGVGEKQAARLIAVVGDPYLLPDGTPRTVSQLWAYCGHGDPSRRLKKGMTQAELFTLGNPVAKSRTWLISCAILKAQGPLSATYYDRKAATDGRLHATECRRCGPSGSPALPGSPWSDAHRHADALRVTGKRMLRDLWLEAKRLHEESS